jgi:hypothetical protein
MQRLDQGIVPIPVAPHRGIHDLPALIIRGEVNSGSLSHVSSFPFTRIAPAEFIAVSRYQAQNFEQFP